MTETENPPKSYCLTIDKITPEVMKKVVEIYEDTVGKTSGTKDYSDHLVFGIADEIDDLNSRGFTERRIGSTLTHHSKLQIRRSRTKHDAFYFAFSPNLNSQTASRKDKDAAGKLSEKFNSNINEYLQSSGVGVEV